MKTIFALTLFLFVGATSAAVQQIPNKAFDVRNGNGVIDGATTYPFAIVIPFRDKAAKDKFLQDYADNNNWANQSPQQPIQQFVLDGIKQWMKSQSVSGRQAAAQKVAVAPDTSDLP
jgi:hypothetical protein